MIHKAIYSLYPNATYINEESQAFDAQGNLIELNMVTVNAEVARLQSEYDAKEYQRLRSYPKIGDQLDMLWHAIDNGTLNKTSDFYTAIKAVKDAHPKE
jgi:hypothetical protein